MAQQTIIEWFLKQTMDRPWKEVFEEAKQMERERRKEDIKIGYNQGYLDAQCNHVNDADSLSSKIEYLQSRIDNIDALIKDKQNKIADLLINNFPESK